MNIKKRIAALFLPVILLLQVGCKAAIPVSNGISSYTAEGVAIQDMGTYYNVSVDYTAGLSRKEMGAALAKAILEVVPNYEYLIDSYIAENITQYEYPYSLFRAEDIKSQLDKEYYEELEGMGEVFSGGETNEWNDGRISADEVFLFNLFPDVIRNTQCSFVSVYGERSETGNTITGRNLDWYSGSVNQLPLLHSIMTIDYGDKKLCSVGFLGFMGIITAINDSKVFAGILDATTGQAYDSAGKRSYVFDLRYAMENTDTMDAAAEYMLGAGKHYAVNHLIGFSDPTTSFILENNISGIGIGSQRNRRAIRYEDSKLNDNITWGISNAVGTVNSFLLYGNHDNHTQNKYNTLRWKNMKSELLGKGETVSAEEMQALITFKEHDTPASFSEGGDLYNKMTLQTMVFEPKTMELSVFMQPRDTKEDPKTATFVTVSLFE